MPARYSMRIFSDKYPLLGPIIWILCIQYFVLQAIVASAWSQPFSLLHNTISDLGNTVCAQYGGRFVCSPDHSLMNASFIMLGITMSSGAMLIYREFKRSVGSFIGFSLLGIAGLGSILVGLFPENTVSQLHVLGAAGPFLLGNTALLVLGFSLPLSRKLRLYTLLTAFIALIALGLFMTKHYLGLDEGGMERIVAYPQTIWLIFFGLYMSHNQYRLRRHR